MSKFSPQNSSNSQSEEKLQCHASSQLVNYVIDQPQELVHDENTAAQDSISLWDQATAVTVSITNDLHFLNPKTNQLVENKIFGQAPFDSMKSNLIFVNEKPSCGTIVGNKQILSEAVNNPVNVESTLSSDDFKAKSEHSSTLLELYKSVLEYWIIGSSDEILTESEFININEKLNESFLKNKIPTDNDEFKKFLLENDIPTDVDKYKKFLLENVIPTDGHDLYSNNSPGKCSKLISEKIQGSVCVENMISNNFKQKNVVLNTRTFDKDFLSGVAASLPISSFRSKSNVDETQEQVCDKDMMSKITKLVHAVLNSNNFFQSFKTKPSTAGKELKIISDKFTTKCNAEIALEKLYFEESFSTIDKPEFVVKNSNSFEENIMSVKPLPGTTENNIDNKKKHTHDFECRVIKHVDIT